MGRQDAIAAFGSALDWWRASGNSGAAGQAALGLGLAHWRLEEIGPARAALQRAVALLSEQPSADTMQALIGLGSLLVLSLHEHTEARDYLEMSVQRKDSYVYYIQEHH